MMNTIGNGKEVVNRVLSGLAVALLLGGCAQAGGSVGTSSSLDSPVQAPTMGASPSARTFLVGSIRAPDGGAIEGAYLGARLLSPPGSFPLKAILTDAQGSFRFTMRAGTFRVTVGADGFQTLETTVTLRSGQTLHRDFVLRPKAS